MAIVGCIMLTALLLRPDLEVSVLHDRNPLYVRLSDGGLRNGYTVKLLNKLYEPRTYSLALEGLPGATLSIIGPEHHTGPAVTVPPDDLSIASGLCHARQGGRGGTERGRDRLFSRGHGRGQWRSRGA